MDEKQTRPRLYLITRPIGDATAIKPVVQAALNGPRDIAALLLRLSSSDERQRVNIVKEMARLAQAKGIAVLVEDDVAAAMRGGADGVHITKGLQALRDAIAALKPQRIVGAGNLATKHAAMEAGEAGADYVMFGEPVEGRALPSPKAVVERARWWAEIFETPGVAFALDDETAKALEASGIEFVARMIE